MSGKSQTKAEGEFFDITIWANPDGSIRAIGTGVKVPIKESTPAKKQLPKGSGKRKSK